MVSAILFARFGIGDYSGFPRKKMTNTNMRCQTGQQGSFFIKKEKMTTGRNEPCPCGSGKKYKKCCMQRGPDPINYMKQKLNRFHERVVGDLLQHGAKVFGPEALDEAAEEFFGWSEEKDVEEIDFEYHETLFYPWFLFKWRIESADSESSLPGPRNLSIVQSYLQSQGKRLDPVEREYLASFADAPFTFFEITAVEPGKSVSLKDLLLDRDYRVLEKTASQSLQKGDVVFGSAFETGGISLFGALGMITFKPSAKIEILATRKMMLQASKGLITADTLEEYDMELRDLYLDLFMTRTATIPALCNTDGDKLSFHTLKYTISSPRKVFDALKGLANGFTTEDELLEKAQFDENGVLRKVEISWILPTNAKHGGMENTVHGHLIIDGMKLTCEVNSAERAERLRAIIENSLPGGEATFKTTVIQSADSMMRKAPPYSDTDGSEHEELLNHPEVRAHIEQMMRKHWEAWLDMELPVLQGKTPRQAVGDELGRQQVNALLEDAEKSCREGDGAMGSLENIENVRRALGLESR